MFTSVVPREEEICVQAVRILTRGTESVSSPNEKALSMQVANENAGRQLGTLPVSSQPYQSIVRFPSSRAPPHHFCDPAYPKMQRIYTASPGWTERTFCRSLSARLAQMYPQSMLPLPLFGRAHLVRRGWWPQGVSPTPRNFSRPIRTS